MSNSKDRKEEKERDKVLKRMLETPPKPQKPGDGRGNNSPARPDSDKRGKKPRSGSLA